MAYVLRKKFGQLKMSDPILWIFNLDYSFIPHYFPSCLTIYHCVDLHTADTTSEREKRWIERQENSLLESADMVLCTSRRLFSHCSRKNPRTFLVPNGADFPLFAKASDPSTPLPLELKGIRRPIIGYVGSLDERIDKELISHIVRRRGDWSLVLVGRRKREFGSFPQGVETNNLHFFDQQPMDRLPGFLKAFDVCIIPYLVNPLTEAVYPLKVNEYLAAGKPVVSTALNELEPLKEVVLLSGSKEEFYENILRALTDVPEKVKKRQEIAMQNDWEARVQEISRVIKGFLEGRRSRPPTKSELTGC